MSDNLKLWSEYEKTDTKYTKKVTQRGGYTAISPQYQLKLATKAFGSYGFGFGLESSNFDYSIFESTGVVLHDAVFFYHNDSGKQSFPIKNAIQAKQKDRVDVDFAKKLETNTVSKALSKLGFNADVYMGEFDDLNYFNERNLESQVNHASDKDAERAKQFKALETDCYKVIEQINTENKTLSVVEGLYKAMFRKIGDKPECKRMLLDLTKAKDAAKERIGND